MKEYFMRHALIVLILMFAALATPASAQEQDGEVKRYAGSVGAFVSMELVEVSECASLPCRRGRGYRTTTKVRLTYVMYVSSDYGILQTRDYPELTRIYRAEDAVPGAEVIQVLVRDGDREYFDLRFQPSE